MWYTEGDDAKKFTYTVFGATGFTGKHVVKELARTKQQESKTFAWAVAGRSKPRLVDVLKETAGELNTPLDDVGVLLADVCDPDSLATVCIKTRVLLNCVGPYRFYGEQVVSACIENGTDYVDITGEPEFVERMQLKYGERAKEKGVCIVHCCGFDSIPADIGCLFTSSHFPASTSPRSSPPVNPASFNTNGNKTNHNCASIESFLTLHAPKGLKGHYTTWESAVHGFSNQDSLHKLRKEKQDKEKDKRVEGKGFRGPVLRRHSKPAWHPELNSWVLPFLGADAAVVRSSQKQLSVSKQQHPVQYAAYFTLPSGFYVVLFLILGTLFRLLCSFGFGRWLLLKFPGFFSFGMFSHEGPDKQQLQETSFSMTFFGSGYKTKTAPAGISNSKPDWRVVTRVSGPEPGYIATPICLVQCALCLVEYKGKLKLQGVLTPGAAFVDTDIIQRLKARGLEFATLSEEEVKQNTCG